MIDHRRISYWLETSSDDLTPREPLDGSTTADVAILGAGFSGLWTARALLERDPTLRIVVVEQEIAGFGASGRNGAWCTAGFGAGPGVLTERFGRPAAQAVHDAMVATVDAVGAAAAAEGIDAHYQRDGEVILAIGAQQIPRLDAMQRAYDALGRPDFWTRLDAAATRERIAVEGAVGAIQHPHTAAVHPGRLVRGLARAVEARGVRIVEGTRVVEVRPGPQPALVTDRGIVSAQAVVLAGEAYLTQLPKRRRTLLPLYSLIVLTEPLSDEQIAEIRWTHRAVVQSSAYTVDYLSRTADNRILFGGRGAPYHYASRIASDYDRHADTHERLRRTISEWFPALAGVTCTHQWGGVLGVPRDWIPTMRFDRRTGIAGAYGYTGEGVAATNLAGRVLADLITEADSPLTELPMAHHEGRSWEPEPLRWIAARAVHAAALRADARSARTGRAVSPRSVLARLLDH